ncbi:FAD-binding oxidoreductase [Patescibacteria group bacterium]|nr:FAD-binding oxidoreductase [Patescibacteria group bacterium]
MRHFNQVIRVDAEHQQAEVEGMTTYYDLVEETIKHGLLPKVTPELRTITVGGAISGVAAESSSFKYGLVHETVREMEVLTGTGEVVLCTPKNEHDDLFFGLPNSYGTFGYILKARIDLMPAAPYVKLAHHRFKNLTTYFDRLNDLTKQPDIDFLDGAIFSDDTMIITVGRFVKDAPYTSNYRSGGVYYKSMQSRAEDYLTTKDYIWRWDADSFWSTRGTPLQNKLFRKLFGEKLLRSDYLHKIVKVRNKIRHPYHRWRGIRQEEIIQDVGISIYRCAQFVDWFAKEVGIYPLWICPVTSVRARGSYPLFELTEEIHCDIGFFSTKRHDDQTLKNWHYNKLVERQVDEMEGIKCLYSNSFYTKDRFWEIFNGAAYFKIKQKYDPQGTFLNLYQKCVLNR